MVTKSKSSLLITKQRLSNGAVKGRGSGCCSIQHFTLDSAGIWCYFCESTATSGAANGGAVPSTGTLLRLGRLRPGFGAPGKLSSGEFSANDAARGARTSITAAVRVRFLSAARGTSNLCFPAPFGKLPDARLLWIYINRISAPMQRNDIQRY